MRQHHLSYLSKEEKIFSFLKEAKVCMCMDTDLVISHIGP